MKTISPDIIISWYCILPALVAISMAFITKQVLPSLFFGIVTGGFVLFLQTGNLNNANKKNSK